MSLDCLGEAGCVWAWGTHARGYVFEEGAALPMDECGHRLGVSLLDLCPQWHQSVRRQAHGLST